MTELIDKYAELKKIADKAKEEAEKVKSEIKSKLEDEGIDVASSDDWTVTRIEVDRDELNEEKLIQLLRSKYTEEQLSGVIKIVEVVDLTELEDRVYNRIVDGDDVQSCIIHKKPSIRLNIKERKK